MGLRRHANGVHRFAGVETKTQVYTAVRSTNSGNAPLAVELRVDDGVTRPYATFFFEASRATAVGRKAATSMGM